MLRRRTRKNKGDTIIVRSMSAQSYEELLGARMKELEEAIETANDDVLKVFYLRARVAPLKRMFAWAVPNAEAIDAIKNASPNGVCEVGAGLGLWASLLRDESVKVWAYDIDAENGWVAGGYNQEKSPPIPFDFVDRGDVDVAKEHSEQSLFLCWPPPEDEKGNAPENARFAALNALTNYKGDTVIHIGEGVNGETDGERFRQKLIEEDFKQTRVVSIPNFPNAFDKLSIFKRQNRKTITFAPSKTYNLPPMQERASEAKREIWNQEREKRLSAQKYRWEELCVEHVERKREAQKSSSSSFLLSNVERDAIEAVSRRSNMLRRFLLRRLI